MVDVTVRVLEPADSYSFMTLEDAKIFLGISAEDTSQDAQLQMTIDMNSASIARMVNRVFGKEKVEETWRCVGPVCCPDGTCRVFLMRWPLKAADIESVESPRGNLLDPASYEVEEESGKLTLLNGCSSEIVIVYTGGYDLPEEAPLELQQATGILTRESRTQAAQEAVSGIRMIAHKEARVMFHSPAQSSSTTRTGGAGSAATRAVEDLLTHFTRYWI